MLQTIKDTNAKRLHKLVDYIDIKVDEEISVRDVSSVESTTEDVVEFEDEQVQE
jgi:hypothetical protein